MHLSRKSTNSNDSDKWLTDFTREEAPPIGRGREDIISHKRAGEERYGKKAVGYIKR